MAKLFDRLDSSANRIGIWWALLGPGGVLVTAYSIVSAYFDPVAKNGWAAVVLFAVALTLATLVITSFSLLAWRYFRPLDQEQRKGALLLNMNSPESTNTLGNLGAQIATIKEAFEDRIAIAERALGKATTEQKTGQQELNNLRSEVAALKRTTNLDLLEICDWATERGIVLTIDKLIRNAPIADENNISESYEERTLALASWQEFVIKVRSELAETRLGQSIGNLMEFVKGDADMLVEQIPRDKRPSFDHLEFRKHYIAALQCRRVVGKLLEEQHERAERDNYNIRRMIERTSMVRGRLENR
jgi:hypothetical protein